MKSTASPRRPASERLRCRDERLRGGGVAREDEEVDAAAEADEVDEELEEESEEVEEDTEERDG